MSVDVNSDALASVQARIARNKAKREQEEIVSKAHFAESPSVVEIPRSEPLPGKQKTKAKAKYLKRKAERRKAARKQPALPEPSSEPVELDQDGDTASERPRKKKRKLETEDSVIEELDLKSSRVIEKANKALAKAERHAKMLSDLQVQVEPSLSNVVQLEGLPRFAKPAKASKADEAILHDLATSETLKDGMTASPEMTIPLNEFLDPASQKSYLCERLAKRLGKQDITSLFAVQCTVLPILLSQQARRRRLLSFPVRDLYVNAPTGSGKTLAYVLPLVELLSHQNVRQLRAVIVLPTRDLAIQIKQVFDCFCNGSGLKTALAVGQQSFKSEQAQLEADELGICNADILIGTPGRILDHLEQTQGFTLQHLQYFVVDEADRLLNQSFNDWLPTLLDAMRKEPQSETIGRQKRVQKLLFSATLSRNSITTAALRLEDPLYIAVTSDADPHTSFTLPSTLQEHLIPVPAAFKPLILVKLIQDHSISRALCFVHSTQTATRLVRLVNSLSEELGLEQPVSAVSFSAELAAADRARILSEFRSGQISLLVCSDLIARGMDIAEVEHVFNYDCPTDMRKYVHRVGRTARAGRAGQAWTLVESEEVAPFKAVMRKSGRYEKLNRIKIKEQSYKDWLPDYKKALDELKDTNA